MSKKSVLLAMLVTLTVSVGDAAAAHAKTHPVISIGTFSGESSSGQAAAGAGISISQSGSQSADTGGGSEDTGSGGGLGAAG